MSFLFSHYTQMKQLLTLATVCWLLIWSTTFASNHVWCSDKSTYTTQTHSNNYQSSHSNKEYAWNMSSKDHMRERMQMMIDRMAEDQLQALLWIIPKYERMIPTSHTHYWVLEELQKMLHNKLWINTSSSIVDIAVGTDDLSILVDIVTALDLGETLSWGEYTVFAPTNDAFEALLVDLSMTFDELASNKELLKTVVLYHVVEWTIKANDVVWLTEWTLVPTIWWESVRVSNRDGVYIDNSKVTATDIMASNWVVHLIDTVLLPPSVKESLWMNTDRGAKDIVTTAVESNAFPTLVAAVQAAELVETLQWDWPFTVYAPTEEAFASALNTLWLTADELLADKETLTSVLTYHVVPWFYTSDDIVSLSWPIMSPTVNGAQLTINPHNWSPMVNDANIVQTDIYWTNWVIHVIDKVLLP